MDKEIEDKLYSIPLEHIIRCINKLKLPVSTHGDIKTVRHNFFAFYLQLQEPQYERFKKFEKNREVISRQDILISERSKLLQLPYRIIVDICQTNSDIYRKYCQDNRFWFDHITSTNLGEKLKLILENYINDTLIYSPGYYRNQLAVVIEDTEYLKIYNKNINYRNILRLLFNMSDKNKHSGISMFLIVFAGKLIFENKLFFRFHTNGDNYNDVQRGFTYIAFNKKIPEDLKLDSNALFLLGYAKLVNVLGDVCDISIISKTTHGIDVTKTKKFIYDNDMMYWDMFPIEETVFE